MRRKMRGLLAIAMATLLLLLPGCYMANSMQEITFGQILGDGRFPSSRRRAV